jgi:uncharacterized protein (UPF0212 family)
MCPGVESDKPGDCPKCGMALERNPAWVVPAAGKVYLHLPNAPGVQQDHPGDCPKCGMALEPKTISARPTRKITNSRHDAPVLDWRDAHAARVRVAWRT